jgi:tetratricopeptide (TPR) repeat protein
MSFSPKTRPRFFLYYTFSCTAYGLALFSKEMAITLPILLILYHLLHPSGNPINSGNKPLTRPYSANIIRLLFFYSGYISVTGFYLYLRFIVFKNTYKIIEISQSNVFAMAKVVASYLKLLFIPVHLNADYCVPPAKYPSISFILSSLLIISALIIIVRLRHTYKQATFFNMWFFITLLPVLGIIPIGNIMAERYLYLPIVGFCASSGYMLANKTLRNKGIIIAGIIILGMQLYTVGRNIVWRDNATLWFYTYKREPDSARACSNLGNFYFGNKHYEKAIQMYKKALTFQYSYPFIHFNLGVAYEKAGLTDLAMNEYKASISRHSDNTLAYNNLGTIYHKQGLHDLAIEAYNQSLAINPHYPPTHFNLGNTYESAGNYEKALSEYNAAIKEDIFYADAHNNIGAIYLKKGLTNQAIEEYKKTIQLKPDHLDAHYNLGIAYAGKNSFPEAIQELQLALQYNPNDFAAYRELGILYFKHEKDINKSLHYLRESLKCVKDPAEATKLEEFIQAIHAELNSEKQR